MARTHATKQFPATADEMWSRIGDPAALATWHPAVDATEMTDDGQTRINHLGAARVVEPIIDRGGRHYTFRMSETPLPLRNFESTLRVRDDGPGKCVVEWEASYEPIDVSDAEADELVGGFFEAGLAAL